jgi:hypothetical protein
LTVSKLRSGETSLHRILFPLPPGFRPLRNSALMVNLLVTITNPFAASAQG